MLRMSATIIGFAPLALAAIACEGEPDTTTEAQHRIQDSAGIRIVENPRPAPGSRLGWRIGTEPVISIGTVEGGDDFQLHRVDDALKLSDGRIIVANGGSHQLLGFDEAGNYLTAWGQKGEGPGDFGGDYGGDGLGRPGVFWMEPWPGDSLAVCHGTFTGGRHVFSIWDTEGHHRRTLNLADLAPGNDVPKCRDVLANGTILASVAPFLLSSPAGIPETGLRRSEVDFFLVDAEGSRRPSLGKHPGAAMFWHWEDDPNDSFLIMDPPFQPTVLWAAWGEQVIVSPTDLYEIRAYRSDGSLARIVRRDNNVRTPTQADLDSYGAENRSPDPSRRSARNRNAAIDALPLPESFPAFSAIVVDAPGNLWVREYNLPEDENRVLWTVFDPDGLVQGFIETPEGLEIYEIGADYILGKVMDELGVEYVQVWALDRSV